MNNLYVVNLKMNLVLSDVATYVHDINNLITKTDNVVICPTHIHIPFFSSNNFKVGAQDLSIYEKGSYTGEVSALQLSNSGVTHTILGHSDRRRLFDETDELINIKIKQALKHDIIPIICLGESKSEKVALQTTSVLRRRLLDILKDLTKSELSKIIIAYEPIWAISTTGTGFTPTAHEIDEIVTFIKDIVKSAYKVDIPVLYGGSVGMKIINQIRELENTDGFLIGAAGLNPEELSSIINILEEK